VFTVQKIKQVQAGETDKGPWTKHKVRIETADGVKDVLLFCNQYSPVPAEGSTIEGEIGDPYKPGQLPEFKRARKGAYGGRNGSSRDFKADPVKQAAIAMEASQKAAVEIVRMRYEHDLENADALVEGVQMVAARLYEQIQQAMSEAEK
jgi:hypothetical protein